MKFTITLLAILVSCFLLIQCTLINNNKSAKTPAKTKTVMYKYLTDGDIQKFSKTTDRNSEYYIFFEDNTFIYESHKDTYFSFVFGSIEYEPYDQMYLIVDTITSKELIKTYRDSTIWNYRLATKDFSGKTFYVYKDTLTIFSNEKEGIEEVLIRDK